MCKDVHNKMFCLKQLTWSAVQYYFTWSLVSGWLERLFLSQHGIRAAKCLYSLKKLIRSARYALRDWLLYWNSTQGCPWSLVFCATTYLNHRSTTKQDILFKYVDDIVETQLGKMFTPVWVVVLHNCITPFEIPKLFLSFID